MTKLETENTHVPGIFNKPSLFTKNKLKETPIQRQSLQDLLSFVTPGKLRIVPKFPQNSFFQRSRINKPGSFRVIPFIVITYLYKNQANQIKVWMRKYDYENQPHRTKSTT